MNSNEEILRRIEKLEKDYNCQKLEEKIKILENEVKHLKAVIQYHMRNKIK